MTADANLSQPPTTGPTIETPAVRPRRPLALWVGGGVLVLAAAAVYWPALSYGFVGWDDDRNVTMNPMVALPAGLVPIWTNLRGPAGLPNYPLFYTSFWLEYRLWGPNPAGYHATNLVLHALNGVLLLALLRRLGMSRTAAWVVALLFAVHPMQVESVAWITERKNVLSGAFYLLAFLFYARHRQRGDRRAYGLALAAIVLALLSKTASVTLVGSLFLADCFLLRPGGLPKPAAIVPGPRILGRAAKRLLPFAIVGAAASLLLVAVEDRPATTLSAGARPLVVGQVMWFYVSKLLWPAHLTPIYPRWAVAPSSPSAWLPLAGLVLAVGLVWHWRRAFGPHRLWGLGHFLVTLAPVSGLLTFGYHSHSWVADRFVYVACVGVFVVIAVTAERLLHRLATPRAAGVALATAGIAAAIGLAVVSRRQLPTWLDSEHLWARTIADNPASWVAQGNYGSVLCMQGRHEEALTHWRRSLELEPLSLPIHIRIAVALRALGRGDEAVAELRAAAAAHPEYPDLQAALADALAAQGNVREAISMLKSTAWAHRTCFMAYDRLAWIYATSPHGQYRNAAEAVRLAESAVNLTRGQQTQPLDTLAAAYAEAGQFDRAGQVAEQAIRFAERDGDGRLAEQIRARRALYEAGRAYRDRAAETRP